MCDICHSYPCDSRCPNSVPELSGFICKSCGDAIVKGEEYVSVLGAEYHKDCLDVLCVDDWLDLFGIGVEVAGE